MTKQEKVKTIYPEAYCKAPHNIYVNYTVWASTSTFTFSDGKFWIIGEGITRKLAWKNAWEEIEYDFLRKLKS